MKFQRDKKGCFWQIEAFVPKDPKKHVPSPAIEVWWDRDSLNRSDELLVIRQECRDDRADVVICTLGQAYDLLTALVKAIEDH